MAVKNKIKIKSIFKDKTVSDDYKTGGAYKAILNIIHLCKGAALSTADAKELSEYLSRSPDFTDKQALYKLSDFDYPPNDLWSNVFTKAEQED